MVGKRTRLKPLAALVVSSVVVSGCAETNLASHLAKKAAGDHPPPATATTSPIYKVGKPYQVGGVWYYPREDFDYNETGIASWYGPNFHGKLTADGEVFDQNAISAAHKTLPLPSVVRVTNLDTGRSLVVRVNDRGPFVNGRIIDLSRRAAELLGIENRGTAKVRVQILADESRALASSLRREGETRVAAAPRADVIVDSAPAVPQAAVQRPVPANSRTLSPMARMDAAAAVAAKSIGQMSQEPARATSIYVQVGSFSRYENAVRFSRGLSTIGRADIHRVLVKGQTMYRVRLGPAASVDEADQILDKAVTAGHQDARVVVD